MTTDDSGLITQLKADNPDWFD